MGEALLGSFMGGMESQRGRALRGGEGPGNRRALGEHFLQHEGSMEPPFGLPRSSYILPSETSRTSAPRPSVFLATK